MPESNNHLVRGLTFVDSTSIVICSIIGTGVFLKSAVMAQEAGSPLMVMAAWAAAGLLSLAGALTYAELGALLPNAGGDYVYLRAAYGNAPAFLYGWMYFTVGASGAAALGTAFATFLSELLPFGGAWMERTYTLFGHSVLWQFGARQIIAVAAIILCAVINYAGVSSSGRVQTAFTAAKMIGVIVIIVGVFFFAKRATWDHVTAVTGTVRWCGTKAFGAAMIAALWAYNGWSFLPMVAGEVRNPGRTIPRALITGMIVVLLSYCLANLAYFYALPFNEVVTSNSTLYRNAVSVAGKAAQTFLGPFGIKMVTVLFVVSSLGTLHSELLAVPRIHFAMARDGLFFRCFGPLSRGAHVPAWAVSIQAAWASVLASSGTFDQLTTLLIFSLWIFFGFTAASVFVLRRSMPDAPRPYRTIGYPVVPLAFILSAVWLVTNTLRTNPIESAFGITLIVLGLPLFLYFRAGKRRSAGSVADSGNLHERGRGQ
ncbi:amino acid permease [bacterium]|nr:amino acid permease [bacterium]